MEMNIMRQNIACHVAYILLSSDVCARQYNYIAMLCITFGRLPVHHKCHAGGALVLLQAGGSCLTTYRVMRDSTTDLFVNWATLSTLIVEC